jgi:hypothetical protein
MKKIICILFLVLLSCSKDDPEEKPYIYTIYVVSTCPKTNTSVSGTHRVSKTTYERVEQDYDLGTSCFYATFNDLSGTSKKGYVTGLSACNSCGS